MRRMKAGYVGRREVGIENWSESIVLVNLAPEPQMSEELRTVIEIVKDRGDCDVVIDFAEVEVVTSSTIAKLLTLRKILKDREHRLVLCGLTVQNKGVFLITGLESAFDFVDDQFVALASLQMVN
jgi:anti-anti-sigma factor